MVESEKGGASDANVSKLKKTFDVSNFDINTLLRGAQLTLVGAHRALQNPDIFTSHHYKQAAYAVAAGIIIRLAVAVPIIAVKMLIWLVSFVLRLDAASFVDSLDFIGDHVLQVPLFLMALMKYLTPALDDMFMESLRWVDITYVQKHKGESPDKLREMYYPNLKQYPVRDASTRSSSTMEAVTMYLWRSCRKGAISLAVFGLSFAPVVGPFVLPAASFYTFKEMVGMGPASAIFGCGLVLPRRYLVVFLQAFFASRTLMRELLEPYFARVHFTGQQKRRWFRSREGLLFGFGVGFYVLVRVPLVGVLIYGIAEASTAYLITKITDPPPPPSESEGFAATQQEWTNKHEFLSLSLGQMD